MRCENPDVFSPCHKSISGSISFYHYSKHDQLHLSVVIWNLLSDGICLFVEMIVESVFAQTVYCKPFTFWVEFLRVVKKPLKHSPGFTFITPSHWPVLSKDLHVYLQWLGEHTLPSCSSRSALQVTQTQIPIFCRLGTPLTPGEVRYLRQRDLP
jgi:hypothetical protein